MKPDGTIDKYKARLVVKGYRQKKVWTKDIHQMDVKTSFLNGELEEEICMEQPKVFIVPGKAKKVSRLVK